MKKSTTKFLVASLVVTGFFAMKLIPGGIFYDEARAQEVTYPPDYSYKDEKRTDGMSTYRSIIADLETHGIFIRLKKFGDDELGNTTWYIEQALPGFGWVPSPYALDGKSGVLVFETKIEAVLWFNRRIKNG